MERALISPRHAAYLHLCFIVQGKKNLGETTMMWTEIKTQMIFG